MFQRTKCHHNKSFSFIFDVQVLTTLFDKCNNCSEHFYWRVKPKLGKNKKLMQLVKESTLA